MSTVTDAPAERQGGASPTLIDLCDPTQARVWLALLRDTVRDGAAAGEDATRRPKKRMFSRFEARRRVREASQSTLAMIDAAERALSAVAPK
ncbi:MAG: hypothetical protein U0359_36910 [Byssovorax sp.]